MSAVSPTLAARTNSCRLPDQSRPQHSSRTWAGAVPVGVDSAVSASTTVVAPGPGGLSASSSAMVVTVFAPSVPISRMPVAWTVRRSRRGPVPRDRALIHRVDALPPPASTPARKVLASQESYCFTFHVGKCIPLWQGGIMAESNLSSAAAADALTEIHARRAQAIDATLVPFWYWPAVGGLTVVFTAAVESGKPWLVAAGSVAFALGLAAVVGRVALRHPAQVRSSLLGLRGVIAIFGWVLGLVALGLATGFAADSAGLGYPGTAGAAATAAAMTATGPWLMRHLRGVMATRPIGAGR
ncbi:hypothetical protein [Micromonospora maritima]|uniref:hypothetical protein n=1 Tax=Micromonospora maritima TaxID=986711 RepID=UPI003796C7FD